MATPHLLAMFRREYGCRRIVSKHKVSYQHARRTPAHFGRHWIWREAAGEESQKALMSSCCRENQLPRSLLPGRHVLLGLILVASRTRAFLAPRSGTLPTVIEPSTSSRRFSGRTAGHVELAVAPAGLSAVPHTLQAETPAAEHVSIISQKLQKRNAPTVWMEFSALAATIPGGAVNLGQGFPDWTPPEFVLEAGHKAIAEGHNQYTRTAGHPDLVGLLAERYSRHMNRSIDAMTEVAVTVGASQALFLTLQAILSPGDEVILLEPFFDLYVGQIRIAGGVPKFVPMVARNGGWEVDFEGIQAATNSKTRAIILNSPHNPTGKVFSRDEMEALAAIVRSQPRMLVVSDEVYKYTIYDNHSEGHVHFASLPGMWDRTLTVSSAGKTFSVTGWQVGWVVGRRELLSDIQTALPYVQFCASTPMQEAIATVIRRADQPYEGFPTYYDWLANVFSQKRDQLAASLKEAGIKTMEAQGGFFLLADTSDVHVPDKYLREGTPAMPVMTRDWAFCRYLALEHGVIAIPTSPFFSEPNRPLASGYVRFTFCKTDATLEAASVRLRGLAATQKPSGAQ